MNRIQGALRAIIGLSIGLPFFLSLLHFSSPPRLFDLAFGLFPFLALTFIASYTLLAVVGRERDAQASASATAAMAWASVVTALLSFVPLWNDGRFLSVIPPSSALVAIATLGVFPLHIGPEAVIRFLPVVMGVMMFRRLRRSSLSMGVRIGASVGLYVFLSVALYSLSWVSGALALSKHDALLGPADAARVLTSAQADGYWTRGQQDRLFAPIGSQAENSFTAIQSAINFLMTLVPFAMLAFSSLRSGSALAKRLASRSSVLVMSVMVIGLAIGMRTRVASSSYTDALALLVAIVLFAYWVAWWRFARDLQTLPQDEVERPHLPLPSGAVSVNDLQATNGVLIAAALIGAFVLGWPVFLSLVAATLVAIVLLPVRLENLRLDTLVSAGGLFFLSLAVGVAALAVGSRDAAIPDWMIRVMIAVAVLVGLERFYRRADRVLPQRFAQAGVLSLSLVGVLLLAHQRVFWVMFLPVFAAIGYGVVSDASWQKYRRLPTYILLGGILVLSAVVPQWIVQS